MFYKNIFNLPSLDIEDIAYVHRRVAEVDFAAARKTALSATVPWLMCFPLDDHLIEPRIFSEFAEVMGKGRNNGTVMSFERAGHNVQKTQAAAVSEAIVNFWRKHWGVHTNINTT